MSAELLAAARKFVRDYEAEVNNRDGEAWLADSGCYECTEGTVPNARNTGLCGYHATKLALGGAA